MGLRPDAIVFTRSDGDLFPVDLDALRSREPQDRRFLIVTAPFGPFSRELASRLRAAGAQCLRMVFNAGDLLDWGFAQTRLWRGGLDGWSQALQRIVREDGITDFVLYGDCNPYCVEAKAIAARTGVNVHVMEQGYFRPFWVTLEQDGVNAHSRLRRDPEFLTAMAPAFPEPPPPVWMSPLTPPAVRRIFFYHLAQALLHPLFAAWRPPYEATPIQQLIGHARRFVVQRLVRKRRLRDLAATLARPGRIYLALLQRPGDSQLTRHSPFSESAEFVSDVVESFARFAPADARLIVKSHPLDPGLERHDRTVEAAAKANGVASRVSFFDDGDLHAMLGRCAGVVTINSTAGLASLEAGRPTLVLGRAIYDQEGLTHRGGLDSFWSAPQAPDPDLFAAFRRAEMARTQINGAYATRQGSALAAREVARRMLAP